jgi:hypothetical protein
MNVRLGFALACLALGSSACAGSSSGSTVPTREKVEMEELRITATKQGEGYSFDVYDAKDLFDRATELLNTQKCSEAVPLRIRRALQRRPVSAGPRRVRAGRRALRQASRALPGLR